MDSSILSIPNEAADGFRLVWSNQNSDHFVYSPSSFSVRIDVDLWRRSIGSINALRLELPPSWVSDFPVWRAVSNETTHVEWDVSAREEPRSFVEKVAVTAVADGLDLSRIERDIQIELRAFSQFDPAQHAFRKPNSVAGWGIVAPNRGVFERTYGMALFRSRFFNGLYRAVVFLGGESGDNQGGICTGLARAALERSLAPGSSEPTLDEILIWHGKQLTDRALLSAAGWLFRPSPRRAYAAVRDEILRDGTTSRCFDVGVPLPWRRDILLALQRQGHTVVPFAVRQSSPERATVSVYDPNDPERSINGSAVMTFMLDENKYDYPPLAGLDLSRTTVIPVEQSAYLEGRTALLASLASLTLAFESWCARKVGAQRTRVVQRIGHLRSRA
jgi:hypothetical protein